MSSVSLKEKRTTTYQSSNEKNNLLLPGLLLSSYNRYLTFLCFLLIAKQTANISLY